MSYLNYDGLAYFKSLLDSYFLKANYDNGSAVIDGNVIFNDGATFKKSITVDSNDLQHPAYIFGNLNGKAKLDWKGQEITSTYIKDISANDNVGTIDYVKGDGTSGNIIIKLMKGATAIANGEAGLVPAPASAQKDYFLRGDGIWAVPTDVYVNQNLIASSNNNQFPILLSGTSGTPATKTNATVGYTDVVSVNPLTNALMASQFISKHPTYNRQSTVTSKVQYSLNFTDVVSGAGHNLGEVVGYIDTLANGGEHELGLRLFGNPNVQGTEEDYVYMGVGLSKTNVAYGHAPSTPLPSAHNEPTDIITRDWLARNGSETGLVHTSMNETIGGIKTFTDETKNTSSTGITTTKLTASGKITGTGTAEISGGSGNTPSLKVTGNETVTGDLSVGGNETIAGNETVTGNISTTNGNISTTNGTVSGKTGSIGTGGLTVTGPSNLNGKVTAGNGLDVTGNTETDTLTVNGNETVGGTLTVTGKITGNGGIDTTTLHATDDVIADDDLTVGDTITVGGQILKKTGTNTTQEYVNYITNQEDTRNTIINNLIKADGGLAQDSNHNIYVKTGDGIQLSSGYVTTRLKSQGGIVYDGSTANSRSLKLDIVDGGGIKYHVATTKEPYSGLVVDFSGTSEIAQNIADQMKADLLSSLGLQVPLTADKNVYVNPLHANSSDVWHKINSNNEETAAIDTNAGSTSKPFKTIAAAIQFITEGFSIGSKTVYLRIQAYAPDTAITAYNNLTAAQKAELDYAIDTDSTSPTYRQVIYYESLSLPSYNVTSGSIYIYGLGNNTSSTSAYSIAWTKASDDTKFYKPIIDTRDTTDNTCMNIKGKYALCGLHLRNNINYRYTSNTARFPTTLTVNTNGVAYVYGCTIESKYIYGMNHGSVSAADAALTGNSVAYVDLRPVNANEGSIYFRAWSEYGGIPNEFYFDRGPITYTIGTNTVASNVNVHLFMIWENSLIDFPSVNTLSDGLYMIAEGNCTVFVSCSGTCRATGGGLYEQSFRRWEGVDKDFRYYDPVPDNNTATSYHNVTGTKYSIVNGGHCDSPKGGFPGNTRGTVNSGTYSVYTGSSNDYNWNSSSLDTVIGD